MGVDSLPEAYIWNQQGQPGASPSGWGWRVGSGSETRSRGEYSGTYTRRTLGLGWGPPDLTLPLVEMAEMERPVMEVTMTESRMMIQVRTVGVGGEVIAPKLGQGISQKEPFEEPESAN